MAKRKDFSPKFQKKEDPEMDTVKSEGFVEAKPVKDPEMIVVKCDQLNVRFEPNKTSKVVHIVPNGTRFMVHEVHREWACVTSVKNPKVYGYVMFQYLEEVK